VRTAGFTLLEVIVALGLTLVVVAAVTAFQSYQLATLGNQAEQIDIQSTTRSVVDLVAREVRKTGRNPQCNAAIGGLVEAKTQLMRLQTDLDGDGQISGVNEDVSYGWSDARNAMFRIDHGQTSSSGVLIDGVDLEGSAFHYFDGNGNELSAEGTGLDLAQRRQVRRVRLDLVMTEASPGRDGLRARASASTNLDLRNRFFVAVNSHCTPTVAMPTVPPPGTPKPSPTCAPAGAECVDDAQCCKNCNKKDAAYPDLYFCG